MNMRFMTVSFAIEILFSLSGTVVVVLGSLLTPKCQAEAFQFGGEAENREQNRKKEKPAPDEPRPGAGRNRFPEDDGRAPAKIGRLR
ncbi:hypothetical protein [Rhizobium leguminosarum]|nr:hypothetical protein [Rhizobium leguminosarum]